MDQNCWKITVQKINLFHDIVAASGVKLNVLANAIKPKTRSERPIDTEFLNFRYCLNITIFKYLSINYLNLRYR